MSAINEITVYAEPSVVHEYLRDSLSHIEMVSEDVFQTDHSYVAVMLYQQYFMRAKNRAALMVLISGTIGQSSTRVKTVATASSEGLIFDFDWGAAADFASEPIDLLTRKFETRES